MTFDVNIFSMASIDFQFGLLGFKIGLLFIEALLFATSLFLMLLVLVQRGKGGGLTGALGGMGGQSAFGSKAGDAFTKITVITAVVWITLCMVTIAAFNPPPPPKTLSQQLQQQSGAVSANPDDEGTSEDQLPESDPGSSASSTDDEDAAAENSAGNDSGEPHASEGNDIELDLGDLTQPAAKPDDKKQPVEDGGN